jgi:p-aminobenzoyl-glutamate transporter AbgT
VSGIYYALSIVAVFVVIRWFITNDKVAPNEPTQGLLAMKEHLPDSSKRRSE